ncbi:uncharacterized protein BO87DRAFT_379689 [Aspergillus neoniger CBS 115656]|uniref:Uncharacterized protein n=1 Tax=Aspergillus neoniger (strain CBS 115656) TaxID=1448310 RepID=A0A318Y9E9_ASPNB|nr:hypothetical protein BO87DRAFT_379689 [Aspergillus neoniger CBS 115656]PYH30584.1 hypothetical protein BO87DRAFT_379689 [Aspergillus neoniger CBS 115656]
MPSTNRRFPPTLPSSFLIGLFIRVISLRHSNKRYMSAMHTSFYKVMIDRAKALTQPSCDISLVIFGSSDRQHNFRIPSTIY